MTTEKIIREILGLKDKRFFTQFYNGTCVKVDNQTAKIKIEDEQSPKTVEAVNLNIRRAGFKVTVFFDDKTNKYYAWSTAFPPSKEDIFRFRKTNFVPNNEVELAIAYVFSTECYFDIETQKWQTQPCSLEIERIYDHYTSLLPIQVHHRRIYKANIKGGYLVIKHEIDEHYNLALPYHKPTIEVFRATDFPAILNPFLGGNAGAFDNRSIVGSDLYGFYKAYFIEGEGNFRRLGGWRHYKFIDNSYPHNALEYEQQIWLNHTYQSSLTGDSMTQVMTSQVCTYEILPSFTDNLYIAIWDYGANGKPATDDYGGGISPPVISRVDPHTWHRLSIDIIGHNLGVNALDNLNKPIYLNYPTVFPSLLGNLNVNNLDEGADAFLITIKHDSIMSVGNDTSDGILSYNHSLESDFSVSARFYGNNFTGIYPYKYLPFGGNTYILLAWDPLENTYKITGQRTFFYPEIIANEAGQILLDSIDEQGQIIIKSSSFFNPEYIFNYVGFKGVGYHRPNSHTMGTNQLNNGNQTPPTIDLGMRKFKVAASYIPAGYTSSIQGFQKTPGFPVVTTPYQGNLPKFGLEQYHTFFEKSIINPNEINFVGAPYYAESSEGDNCIIPQFANYTNYLDILYSELSESKDNVTNFFNEGNPQENHWVDFSLNFLQAPDEEPEPVTILIFSNIEYDFELFDSNWDAPFVEEIRPFTIEYEIPEFLYTDISELTTPNSNEEEGSDNEEDTEALHKKNIELFLETFRILLIFPYFLE